ncbi:MAG TPA: hypothetical protein VHG33_12235 [Woeseiaceae bacterium]|nr:hypothetical protein [Woeseiaceae bacterium]
MGSDKDRLPALDENPDQFGDTIVLTDSNVMATREVRQLLYPGAIDEDDEA